jgi:hypothetical protein
MNEELLSLKIQNLKLTSTLENFASQLPKFTTPPVYGNNPLLLLGTNNNELTIQSAAGANSVSGKAMVVFDMTKNPAIVLTANDTFCQMLGYQLVSISIRLKHISIINTHFYFISLL